MNILLTTLGASWAVVPELYGWLHPTVYPFYRHHRNREALDELRAQHGLETPDELWICTTGGELTSASLDKLNQWWALLGKPIPLRIWRAADCDRLATAEECRSMREMLCRVTLLGVERCGTAGQLVVSLAGGRKTMSADIQWAGSVLGAHRFLHVLGPEPLPDLLRTADPAEFIDPPSQSSLEGVMPIVVGQGGRSDLLSIELDGKKLDTGNYPLSLANPVHQWCVGEYDGSLADSILRREKQGVQLLGNYLGQLAEKETFANWRSLYRLPPASIDWLQSTQLEAHHRTWLQGLPKADLHRHLGGTLSLDAQQNVAAAVLAGCSGQQYAQARTVVESFMHADTWPEYWVRRVKKLSPQVRSVASSLLLCEGKASAINRALFAITASDRIALKTRHPLGFSAYEQPGELTGSAVLGHPESIRSYAVEIVRRAKAEGLAYLELRGSPQKYFPDDPLQFLCLLKDSLQSAGARVTGSGAPMAKCADKTGPLIGFIWILDRRHSIENIKQQILTAVNGPEITDGFLSGFDLAGDEGTQQPEQLASCFTPVFRQCLKVTIHAGEGEPAENIWQAAYHLHADRIGHGLSLGNSEALLRRFADRDTCIELCPTSNREVVGFYDPLYHSQTSELSQYPLKQFMRAGTPLCICTDNPGFSNIDLADEFVAASRMTGGLSLWETLAINRKGFQYAFLPASDKDRLMKQVDAQVFRSVYALVAQMT